MQNLRILSKQFKTIDMKKIVMHQVGTNIKKPDSLRQTYFENLLRLREFVAFNPYIERKMQPLVCWEFGLPYLPVVFRKEYRKRFFEYIEKHTTTVATVAKATGIPHKYLCVCKAYFEKKGEIEIIRYGTCPSTGSPNVQFIGVPIVKVFQLQIQYRLAM